MPDDMKMKIVWTGCLQVQDDTERVIDGKKLSLFCEHRYTEVRNYSMLWHDGDVHCMDCGEYIRAYDAG